MGWTDVGQSAGGQDFLKIESGSKVRLHVLTEEPYSYRQAFFNDLKRGAIITDETAGLVVDKRSIRQQHAFWVLTDTGETKIWQMGNRLAEQVKGIFDNYGSLADVDLVVSRTGESKNTKYLCTPVPVKLDLSAVDLESLTPLEEVLLPASSEDVESLVSGVDPNAEFNPQKLEKKAAPVEEEMVETPAEEPVEEEAPPVAKARPALAKPSNNGDAKMPVIREVMMLLAKHPKYKTIQAKAALFKKCAPGKTTIASMQLPELMKVRNELKKA